MDVAQPRIDAPAVFSAYPPARILVGSRLPTCPAPGRLRVTNRSRTWRTSARLRLTSRPLTADIIRGCRANASVETCRTSDRLRVTSPLVSAGPADGGLRRRLLDPGPR